MTLALQSSKIYSLEEAEVFRNKNNLNRTFVATNGCFDLLHPGHVSYLNDARQRGDFLWIFLNTSRSVRQLKGPQRPIQSDEERAYMLSNLSCVSGITFFDTARLTREILTFRPDIYVKASDYTLETLNAEERTALKSVHASIQFIPFLSGYSTTELIKKIQESQCVLQS